jgi:tetratricopeptide (TPR) repeat protein
MGWTAAAIDSSDDSSDGAIEVRRIESIPLTGVGADAAAYLLSGQSGGEVLGKIVWALGSEPADGRPAEVLLVIEVDGASLLEGSTAHTIAVELYGYLLDESGSVVKHLSQGLLIQRGPRMDAIRAVGFKFIGSIDVAPGRYSMRIMVRNLSTRRFFLARRDVEIPSPDDTLVLLPPLVAERSTAWVTVSTGNLDPFGAALEALGLDSWPTAQPLWSPDTPHEIVFGSTTVSTGHSLTARLADVTGRIVLEPPIELGEPTMEAGNIIFRRAVIAASDVPAGQYRLILELSDADSGRTISQSLPVVLVESSPADTWTGLTRGRITEAADSQSPEQEVSEGAVPKREIRRGYLEALGLLAAGDAFSATRSVAELETGVTSSPTAKAWMHLRDAEVRTAAALVRRRPASIMAIALLHRDLYSWYVARRMYGLAEHSWSLAAELAEGARSLDPWKPPEGFPESLLIDLAASLARSGQTRAAHTSLERAVKLAPDNAQALLGLGAIYERSGDVDRAAQVFRRLVEEHPTHREARLRLAVSLSRLGSGRDAEQLLNGLLRGAAPRWIHTLAYQELARLMVADDRLESAERLLQEAREQLPRNQRLRIQLAFTLDREGRSREANAIIEELGRFGGQLTTSPRVRYAEWPDLGVEAAREVLDKARVDGAEALAVALR